MSADRQDHAPPDIGPTAMLGPTVPITPVRTHVQPTDGLSEYTIPYAQPEVRHILVRKIICLQQSERVEGREEGG